MLLKLFGGCDVPGSGLLGAYSGSEARDFKNGTQGATPTGPFKQSYQYDAVSNLTGRTNRFWSQSDSYTATHVNNRNQNSGWHYDADGNVTQNDTMYFSYDAAGRNSWMSEGLVTVTQTFDGDGQVRKRVATNSGFPTTSYFVSSSVLGGKTIAEVDQWGQRQKSFIHEGSRLIATQLQGNVRWQHQKPVVGSQHESTAAGLLSLKSEPEPMGVNMGLEDPYLTEEGEAPNPDVPSLVGGSAGVGSSGLRCTLDGARFDCEQLGFLNDIGAARPCQNNDCGPRAVFNPITRRRELTPLTTNPNSGQLGYWPNGPNGPGTVFDGWGNARVVSGWTDGHETEEWVCCDNDGNLYPQPTAYSGREVFEPQKPVPKPAPDPGQPLSPCVKNRLRPYFTGVNLDDIRVHQGIPAEVAAIADPLAYTEGNRIYFKKGEYDPHSVGGLSDLGHEITHSDQYAKLGFTNFQAKYLREYAELRRLGLDHDKAYWNISFEKEARKKAEIIRKDLTNLMRDFGGRDPCPR